MALNSNNNWRELVAYKKEFIKIVQLLLAYDERSGRVQRVIPEALHYLRKALAHCPPAELAIYLRALGGYRYEVLVQHHSRWGTAATTWIHEDAIQVERLQLVENKEHPVHRIVCLTDLYKNQSRRIKTLPENEDWLAARLGNANLPESLLRD